MLAMRVGFRPESGFELLLTECRGCQHIFKSDILSRHQDSNHHIFKSEIRSRHQDSNQHIIFKSDSQPTFSRHQQTSYLNIEIAIDTSRHHISSTQPASSFRHQTNLNSRADTRQKSRQGKLNTGMKTFCR